MKNLLITIALIEALAGFALLAVPGIAASMLLGEVISGAAVLIIVRITGAALLTLALACLFSRQSAHAMQMVKAMLFYNLAVSALLMYSKLSAGLAGQGLVPAIVLHLGLAAWCLLVMRKK